ncbi:hypothetical protein DBR11_21885 [Pedobacter sp. HMWF019]|uniref:hypothetical protein n=1 Tax=Pedobacter sp. HMWF019 TaxID=2056856 RepID=UPI000D336478|nr:hypothetical protein [Pedobacter sp. HMWF019]PTS95059.1 hypothetical protein DBR11_21885 [Pedobacter sp. HMWF019]
MKLKPFCIPATLLLFMAFNVSAQQGFVLKGVVMERGTTNRITSGEVVNKRTEGSVNTNDLGLFQIKVNMGDTLFVFKNEFANAEVVVQSSKDLIIYLNRSTDLREVNIYGESKKQELDGMRQEYRNKGSFYAGKPPLLSYLFSPLTAIYELFGRTPRNARHFGKFYSNELQQTEIDGFFNESIIKKHTDLKDKDLENFMLNYRPDYSVASKWTEYDAIKYIRDSYKKYTDTLRKK